MFYDNNYNNEDICKLNLLGVKFCCYNFNYIII